MKRVLVLSLTLTGWALAAQITLYESIIDRSNAVEVWDGPQIVNNVEFTMANDGVVDVIFDGRAALNGHGKTGSGEGDVGLIFSTIMLDGETVDFLASYTLLNHFMAALPAGTHKVELEAQHEHYWQEIITPPAAMSVIQVLVLENQPNEPGIAAPPSENTSSLPASKMISYESSITLPGCVEIRDVAGRTVDCAIENGKVPVGDLPSGTYFARTAENRVIKITKVK